MELKGMTLIHDFYVVVGKQCRTENALQIVNFIINFFHLKKYFYHVKNLKLT